MSKAWQAAQDRMRQRIWDARREEAQDASDTPPPPDSPLHPPELVYPTIVSPRPLLGAPTRVVKRVLHRLLQPLVFGPQQEFNLRVAARLNDGWSEAARRRLEEVSAISEANHRRLEEVTKDLAALRGDLLAARGELQAHLAVVEKRRQAASQDEDPTEARQVDSA